MYRLSLPLLLLLLSTPAVGQTNSKDSQTLQALLTEVRQLHQDFQATALATQKIHVLLYRLQAQNATVARASRRVDDAHAEVNQLENERAKLAADIKQQEDFIGNTANALGDRNAVEAALPALKAKLESLNDQEQQAQDKESAAQEQLRSEQAKLDSLEADLGRIEKTFETVNHPPVSDSQ